jgi:hypothetical protein
MAGSEPKLIGLPSRVQYRVLRQMPDGRIAYALKRPNGVTELRFSKWK